MIKLSLFIFLFLSSPLFSEASQAITYKVKVKRGWNLISSPVQSSLSARALRKQSGCPIYRRFFYPTSPSKSRRRRRYRSNSYMRPNKAYRVYSYKNCDLKFSGEPFSWRDITLKKGRTTYISGISVPIDLKSVKGSCKQMPNLLYQEGNRWKSSSSLIPGKSYYVKSTESCVLYPIRFGGDLR